MLQRYGAGHVANNLDPIISQKITNVVWHLNDIILKIKKLDRTKQKFYTNFKIILDVYKFWFIKKSFLINFNEIWNILN